ncbi:Txe/YoeB family addiction module toxin [Flavobacterium branchiophilum]|uniref:Putative mRNA interferase YoeB n=1 Tax=Flavobacterium branchiophilum (strain FL-15) TaxID=1034807 RepID=G2YZQ0_FLABF|nr:Txe/YoeB family addiction module toxin [Flavobacterium branchiophilum]CCB68159.1 Addiction module toxin, Txe/YoeB family [Flavobacterium branchiophilum FL-15]
MSYHLEFSDQTKIDIAFHKKAGDKAILKKLNSLLEELSEHPRTGTGQIEILKYYAEETFSRRINREHRLIYRIREETVQVLVLSAYGHY